MLVCVFRNHFNVDRFCDLGLSRDKCLCLVMCESGCEWPFLFVCDLVCELMCDFVCDLICDPILYL